MPYIRRRNENRSLRSQKIAFERATFGDLPSAGSSKQGVLNPRKEEEPLTVLEMLAPECHETQSCEYEMQSLGDDQEIVQAV